MSCEYEDLFAAFLLHGLTRYRGPSLHDLSQITGPFAYCWYGIWERPVLKHGPRSLAYLQAVAILIVKA
jgi:hypothetical protein